MKGKKLKRELVEYVDRILDDDGFAVVDVNLGPDAELYDSLSLKGQKDLNGEIYDYIEAQTNVIPAKVPLRIRFHGDIKDGEQEEIRQIMQRHYVMKSFDVSWDLMANFRKALFLGIFGCLMIALYLFLAITERNLFTTEILSVVGSFSLWEVADSVLLERPRLRRERQNIEQSLNQRIEFVRGEEEGE